MSLDGEFPVPDFMQESSVLEGVVERGRGDVICLHQLFAPSAFYRNTKEGHGDCRVCERDPINNPVCKGYVPVGVQYVEVR